MSRWVFTIRSQTTKRRIWFDPSIGLCARFLFKSINHRSGPEGGETGAVGIVADPCSPFWPVQDSWRITLPMTSGTNDGFQ
jgi:hypothetical protein